MTTLTLTGLKTPAGARLHGGRVRTSTGPWEIALGEAAMAAFMTDPVPLAVRWSA